MFIHPHMISSDLVRNLDAQLKRPGVVAHVAVGHTDTTTMVAIGQGFPAPFRLTIQPSARSSRPN